MPLIAGLIALIIDLIAFVGLILLVVVLEKLSRSRVGPAVYERERLIALARDNYICQARYPGCRVRGNITHHIVPARCGGSDLAENLMTVCAHCHPMIERDTCCEPLF